MKKYEGIFYNNYKNLYSFITNVLFAKSTGKMEKHSLPVKTISVFLIIFLFFSTPIFAQEQPKAAKKELDELRLKLNEDGSHYLKLTVLGQLWFRYNQSNPGTTVINESRNQTLDIGIRRIRFQFFGQLSDHTFFYPIFLFY